ncbi:MAG TPA: exopolysaccharide biosynthesis polyprenyl glycosylphosphotransferase [Nocardioidaceae bacterium]|nr:exopolysaccharide biosynthesis polyprenyl glycosylphosphotransferase [Nocardioidaceae bacterium]
MTEFAVNSRDEAQRAPTLTKVVRRAFPRPRRHATAARPVALVWEFVVMALAAIVASSLLPPLGDVGRITVALVLLTFALQVSLLPAYERLRSLVPLRRAVMVGALALVGGATVYDVPHKQLRAAVLVVAVTALTGLVVRLVRARIKPRSITLLVGDRVAVSHLVSQWGPQPKVQIAGVCLAETDDDGSPLTDTIMDITVVGALADVPDVARRLGVDRVVVAPGPVLTAYDVRRLSWALEDSDVELTVAAEVHGAVPGRVVPRVLGRRLLLSVRPTRPAAPLAAVKWIFDRVVSAVLLVLVAPVLATLWLLVRWDTPGPGLFRQARAGQGGATFTMYKLRTMTQDAPSLQAELAELNEGAGPLFKMQNDPRVTKVGRVLRATSLDELPQLFNVLKGDMSLIGPRPALPRETEEYDDWIWRRLSVKPGMTGLWQVSGRSRLGWNEAVRLDLDYVDNVTISGELTIAARTIGAVVKRDGAC